MANDELHVLFHNLSGAINGIDLMSQVSVKFITEFKLEKLEGEFKVHLSSNFKNIPVYYKSIVKKLESVVDALTKIDAGDIGTGLKNAVNYRLGKVKKLIDNSELLYNALLRQNTKENLLRFAKELEKFRPICRSMAETVKDFKEKLVARGKY